MIKINLLTVDRERAKRKADDGCRARRQLRLLGARHHSNVTRGARVAQRRASLRGERISAARAVQAREPDPDHPYGEHEGDKEARQPVFL